MTDRQSVKDTVNGIMARVVKNPDERRSELIAAAQHLFHTKGYEHTSISDIVKQVGVAKGTFYYYFDSKTAVLEAVVAVMVAQVQAIFREIVADDTLDALTKWERALQATGSWKLERKAEIIALVRMQQQHENILLQYKLQQETAQVTITEFAKIIAQGVDEGVFDAAFIEESAAIIVAIMTVFTDEITDLFLNPEHFENPVELARYKYAAMQTSIERVLGAASGTLPLIDEAALTAWFAD